MPKADADKTIADVGLRIAERRAEHGWTQETLAERVGVTAKYVQRVEAGSANLSIRSVVRFANALGVRPGDLFERPKPSPRTIGRPRRPKQ